MAIKAKGYTKNFKLPKVIGGTFKASPKLQTYAQKQYGTPYGGSNVPGHVAAQSPLPPAKAHTANPATLDEPFNFGAYFAEIDTDPMTMAGLEAHNTGVQNWRRQLQSSIGNAVTQGGWDIQGALKGDPMLQEYAGDVTPEVAAAAAANQLSTRAQAERLHTQQLAGNAYEQAARGTLGSGSQAVAATNLTNANVLAQNTAMQQLLDSIRGGVGNFLGQKEESRRSYEQTRAEAAARLAAQEGATYGIGRYLGQGDEEGVPGEGGEETGVASAASTPGQLGVKWGGAGQTFYTKQALADFFVKQGKGMTWAKFKAQHPQAAKNLR